MSIDSHLSELVRRHQTIEEAILAETNHPASDDIKVHELKRKKLHLKDEIERLKQHSGNCARALRRRRNDYCPSGAARASRHSSITAPSISLRRCSDAKDESSSRDVSRASAHTAAPRTRGAVVVQSFLRDLGERTIVRVPDRNHHIAHEARPADPLDRAAGEKGPERRIVEAGEFGQGRRIEVGARRKFRFPSIARELVPRADGEAVVAPIDAIADRGSKLPRNWALVLDREIGNAAPRVELIRRRKRARRTRVEAGAALSAMVRFRRVGRQVEVREDRAQEQPGAKFARHQIGVLALPAEPGACGQGASRAAAPCRRTPSRPPFPAAPPRPGRRRVP